METSPDPWIEALRHSHEILRAAAGPLDDGQLEQASYCSDWSVAQVLSHLGSQAEIFDLLLDAALSGDDPPGHEIFGPIWDTWNARSPREQATEALRADQAVLERFESLDAEERSRLHLAMFGMELDTTGLARMRLGEHAIHTWDIAVVLDPAATVPADAVNLLVDVLDAPAGRSGAYTGERRRLVIETSDPRRHFTLDLGDAVALSPAAEAAAHPDAQLPSEALVRLVYGRLDPAHTPPVAAGAGELDELRAVFPGF